jgi:hypothetical protein
LWKGLGAELRANQRHPFSCRYSSVPYWQLFFSLITPQRNCCKEKILGDEHFSIAHKILERFFSANPLTNLKNIFRKTPTAITLQFVPTNTDANIRGDPQRGINNDASSEV